MVPRELANWHAASEMANLAKVPKGWPSCSGFPP